MSILAFIIVDAMICCFIGASIGSNRGRFDTGALLGLFLGPLGVLLALFLPTTPAAEAARLEAIESERARIRGEQTQAPDGTGHTT